MQTSLLNQPAACRHDGWTPARQRRFCEELAECGQVSRAVSAVGLSAQSAYSFRRRPAGFSFAKAWDAALLLARQRLVDEAFELAFEGSHEIVVRDGVVIAERRKRESGMILATLARLNDLDALADKKTQAIARNFDAFLEQIENSEAQGGDREELARFLSQQSGKKSPSRNADGRFLPFDVCS